MLHAYLPWEQLEDANIANRIKSQVFGIAKDTESLLKLTGEMKFKFEYDTEKFNLLATVLVKLDENLEQAYDVMVPIQISDDEFWTNYFYQVELIKHEHGLPCLLGKELTSAERNAYIDA